MGQAIGRHGWTGKTPCSAFYRVCPKPKRPSGLCTTRGSADVSGDKRTWRDLAGQTVALAAAGEMVAKKAPFPPPPHATVAGH